MPTRNEHVSPKKWTVIAVNEPCLVTAHGDIEYIWSAGAPPAEDVCGHPLPIGNALVNNKTDETLCVRHQLSKILTIIVDV